MVKVVVVSLMIGSVVFEFWKITIPTITLINTKAIIITFFIILLLILFDLYILIVKERIELTLNILLKNDEKEATIVASLR